MALLVLSIIQHDLLDDWRRSLPPDTPNQFAFNIQPEQVAALKTFLAEHNIHQPPFYPMIRGRLIAINDRPISPADYQEPRARRLVDREFNLSWSTQMKDDNRLVEGAWWNHDPGNIEQFSTEIEIANQLGYGLGDRLRFRIADQEIEATVTSTREVNWDSMQVNFFVVAPPALLKDHPTTYITSFHLAERDRAVLAQLVKAFPSVTIIDVAAVVDHIRAIMARVSRAVQFVFLFTVAAGIIVLIAAIQATQAERLYDSAVLNMLGASRKKMAAAASAEFFVIGLIAGTIAGIAALITAWSIAHYALKVPYTANLYIVPVAMLIGVVGVSAVGLLGNRLVRGENVMQVLRS